MCVGLSLIGRWYIYLHCLPVYDHFCPQLLFFLNWDTQSKTEYELQSWKTICDMCGHVFLDWGHLYHKIMHFCRNFVLFAGTAISVMIIFRNPYWKLNLICFHGEEYLLPAKNNSTSGRHEKSSKPSAVTFSGIENFHKLKDQNFHNYQ